MLAFDSVVAVYLCVVILLVGGLSGTFVLPSHGTAMLAFYLLLLLDLMGMTLAAIGLAGPNRHRSKRTLILGAVALPLILFHPVFA